MSRIKLSDLHGPVGPEGPVNPDSAPADTAVAAWISTSGGSATQTALRQRTSVYSVRDFGALGDGVSDDTAAIQATIDAAIAAGGGIVFFPQNNGVHWYFTQLHIEKAGDAYIVLQGVKGSTYLRSRNTTTGPAINIAGVGASQTDITGANYIRHVILRDLSIMGSAGWNGVAQQTGMGVQFQCASLIEMSNVWIGNFNGNGLRCDALWDYHFYRVDVAYCGHAVSDADFAYAVDMRGTTNAGHIYGMHVEQYSLALQCGGGSRLNAFTDCKFESGGAPIAADGTTASPISFLDHYETTFTGCNITEDRNSGKVVVKATQADSSYTTTYNVRRKLIFQGCQFTCNTTGMGVWFLGDNTTFADCIFNRTNGNNGNGAFTLQGGCMLIGNTISMADHGVSLFGFTAGNNTVKDTLVYALTGATNGTLVQIWGAGNYANNVIDDLNVIGQFDTPLGGSGMTNYLGQSRFNLTNNPAKVITGSGTPSVFFTDIVTLTLPSAGNVTNFLHGTNGKRIVLRAANAFATIVFGTGTIVTKSGANVTMTNGQTMQLINDAGVWREV